VIRAVLFDLDGTLLDIDLAAFLRGYFTALGPVVASLSEHTDATGALEAVLASTDAMCRHHPGRTNRAVFHERFLALTGVDLDEASCAERVARFYSETFPALGEGHGPRSGGVDAVHSARRSGRAIALATNPIFPRAAVDERMRWAGLEQPWFDVVTSYENMSACKPQLEYFEQTAALLGVEPAECLMVGDDADLDLAAANAGMSTYYVGEDRSARSTWRGSLAELALLLDELER